MTTVEYLSHVVSELVQEIRPAAGLKRFTSNSQLLGAYTEAAVRRVVARILSPVQVCTGSVTDVDLSVRGEDLPELDTIVWAPCPLPPIFSVAHFGLVPRSSCFGILEIKRSLYSGVSENLRERTDNSFVRKYVSDASINSGFLAGFGVVCVKLREQNLSSIQDLIDSKRVVVLFEEESEGNWRPRPEGVVRLVNRLTEFRAVSNQSVGTLILEEKALSQP
jgi:hypothetical protein